MRSKHSISESHCNINSYAVTDSNDSAHKNRNPCPVVYYNYSSYPVSNTYPGTNVGTDSCSHPGAIFSSHSNTHIYIHCNRNSNTSAHTNCNPDTSTNIYRNTGAPYRDPETYSL